MNLLKPGGRLVYSTCSFNPIENEAVVAAGLNTLPGEFRIVPQDPTAVLPALKRRAGLKTWKVASHEPATKKLVWHESEEAFKSYLAALGEESKDKGRKGVKSNQVKEILPSCWPPANAGELGLEGA
jgi:multisite-specific tRNA:(cytosine-C5)-methyltransferase